MATRQTALFACMLTAVFSAGAHEAPVPGTCTAIGARQVTIGSFRFTEKELIREREQHASKVCPLSEAPKRETPRLREAATRREGLEAAPNNGRPAYNEPPDVEPAGKCGVVDDYHIGTTMMIAYCNSPTLGKGQASFRVARPASYGAKTHHALYRFSDGDLVGTCFICVVKGPIKIGPAHPAEVKPQH